MDILLWTLWEILLFPFAFWVLLKLLGNWYVSLRQKYQLVTNMFLWTNLIMIPHCWFCWNNFNWLAISLKLLLPKTIVLIRKLCTLSGRKAMWLSFNCLCIELAHTLFFFFSLETWLGILKFWWVFAISFSYPLHLSSSLFSKLYQTKQSNFKINIQMSINA